MAQQKRAGDALGEGKVQPGDTEHTNDAGLFDDLGDAIIDGKVQRERPQTSERSNTTSPSPSQPSENTPGVQALNTSMPDNLQGSGALSGSNTTTGRGLNSTVGGAVGGGTQGGGTGGTTDTGPTGNFGQLVGNDVDNATQGIGHRSDTTPVAGGVAENAGRGSDLGDVEHSMSDLADDMEGMSSSATGGIRESDTGGGLSGGMRSGQDKDVRGAIGAGKSEDFRSE